jgi:hypothetical protein
MIENSVKIPTFNPTLETTYNYENGRNSGWNTSVAW